MKKKFQQSLDQWKKNLNNAITAKIYFTLKNNIIIFILNWKKIKNCMKSNFNRLNYEIKKNVLLHLNKKKDKNEKIKTIKSMILNSNKSNSFFKSL